MFDEQEMMLSRLFDTSIDDEEATKILLEQRAAMRKRANYMLQRSDLERAHVGKQESKALVLQAILEKMIEAGYTQARMRYEAVYIKIKSQGAEFTEKMIAEEEAELNRLANEAAEGYSEDFDILTRADSNWSNDIIFSVDYWIRVEPPYSRIKEGAE